MLRNFVRTLYSRNYPTWGNNAPYSQPGGYQRPQQPVGYNNPAFSDRGSYSRPSWTGSQTEHFGYNNAGKSEARKPFVKKAVTSNTLSFQGQEGGRIRVTFDASKSPSHSVVLEDKQKKYIVCPLTQEGANAWIHQYSETKPVTLPGTGEITARIGSSGDHVLVQVSDNEKTINVSISEGQGKLFEAFLKWSMQ